MPNGPPGLKGPPSPATVAETHQNVHSSMRKALVDELSMHLKAYGAQVVPEHWGGEVPSSSNVIQPLITSIFFGGGTPSLADPETFHELIQLATANNPIDYPIEITMEANPTSIETAKLKKFREAGVTRLSMGVQSLIDEDLKYLGRNHSSVDAERCYEVARTVFDRVSFDLIYARHEQQTVESWRAELRKALEKRPSHLSLYSLTIEKGTPFYRAVEQGKIQPSNPDLAAELYEVSVEECAKFGLNQYEVSNFAIEGQESRHNMNYWRLGDYIGVGPGAASRLTARNPSTGAYSRYAGMATKSVERWKTEVSRNPASASAWELLTPEGSFLELMLTGIRTKEGINFEKMAEILEIPHTDVSGLIIPIKSDVPLAKHIDFQRVHEFVTTGHLEPIGADNQALKPTRSGLSIADTILQRVLI